MKVLVARIQTNENRESIREASGQLFSVCTSAKNVRSDISFAPRELSESKLTGLRKLTFIEIL
jgi:hypothetical protein